MKKIFTALTLLSVILTACNTTENTSMSISTPVSALTPVDTISHAHGLAVDISNPDEVYIATHYGLFVLVDDKDLYRVGEATDDYMGFVSCPTDADMFYSSGHSGFGGNIGVQKSEDGGVTWTKISDGVGGPVDFHTMAVSPVDTNLLYGWYGGNLQKSIDAGQGWEIVNTTITGIIGLKASSAEVSTLFAATQTGLMVSTDQGTTWSSASSQLDGAIVTALAIHPTDSQVLLSFSDRLALAKSSDGGETWEAISEDFAGETVTQMDFSPQNPDTIYAITDSNSIYKSTDVGGTWTRVEL